MAPYGEAFYQRAERSAFAARVIVGLLRDLLAINSVLDVGCARGTWLAAWAAAGCADVLGLDGEVVKRNRLAVDQRHFVRAGLAARFAVGRRFDLVQCLEVAEHLPPDRAAGLVADLVTHGDFVLFSAAPPGQGGEAHVNERSYGFWRDLFAVNGYAAFDCVRPAIGRNNEIPFWYRYNMILYVKAARLGDLPPAVLAAQVGGRNLVADVSPWLFRVRKFLMRRLPQGLIDKLARFNAAVAS